MADCFKFVIFPDLILFQDIKIPFLSRCRFSLMFFILILVIVNCGTSNQSEGVKCSDEELIERSFCMNESCEYGQEAEVKCNVSGRIPCKVMSNSDDRNEHFFEKLKATRQFCKAVNNVHYCSVTDRLTR